MSAAAAFPPTAPLVCPARLDKVPPSRPNDLRIQLFLVYQTHHLQHYLKLLYLVFFFLLIHLDRDQQLLLFDYLVLLGFVLILLTEFFDQFQLDIFDVLQELFLHHTLKRLHHQQLMTGGAAGSTR